VSAVLLRIPIGIVVERRKAKSPWADLLWRPVAVLAGLPGASAWTPLAHDGDTLTYYAGSAEIELHRSEADNYRRNLATGAPSIWVALQATGGEPPCQIMVVTADPAEGEGLTEPGQAIVEAVEMRITEGRQEVALDQLGRQLAAASVTEQDPIRVRER